MTVYRKQLYPAKVQPLAASDGYPASGYFAMHITYPDTEYSDAVTDWEYGENTNDQWKQGLTVLIRTPIATSSVPAEDTNVIVVDLKQAATDDTNSKTYNLGTEEATRLIAAKINSRRVKQVGEHSVTRYLRARYVRMSGKPTHTGTATIAKAAQTLRVQWDGAYKHGYPSDLPQTGTLSYTDGDHTGLSLSYTAITAFRRGPEMNSARRIVNQTSFADFTISGGTLQNQIDQVGGSYPELLNASTATITIAGEPAKHTIVLSWEATTPNSAGGYWAAANGSPVIQGLGTSIPIWKLTAKPMDGGNMSLPATNYDSRGSTAVAHTTGHGYVRFSVEGLNSCNMADMPPPDYTVTSPSIAAITEANPDTPASGATGVVKLAELEYGTTLNASAGDMFHLKSGYRATATANSNNMVTYSRDELSNLTYGTNFLTKGIDGTGDINVPRPIFSAKTLNSSRVKGLQISNEHMVFDDIQTTDDAGNILTLTGDSPLGVVIKDFTVQNTRENPKTGEEITGPSSPDGKLEPNLRLELPNPKKIPGEIFVRSGHDRVQAWSNMTWGLGGLTAPDPRSSGVLEASGGVSQFDTHDRMLIFHCKRLLHPDMATKQGLTPNTTAGAVPSGSTRLYAAHRITDHAERGSVLTQANNGTATGYPFPHHRIRFGRQGHSFVTPMTQRGTPIAMRRQLHRSHGSSYSLLFEAETEHKHFGFGSGKSSNSASVFELDTLEVKDESNYEANGSFSSEGLPLSEMDGFRIPDIRTNNSITQNSSFDYLIAPGQEHTATTGAGHLVRTGTLSRTTTTNSGPTRLTLTSNLTGGSRYNTASEFLVNGFILGDYSLSGSRPFAPIISEGSAAYFVSGLEEGVLVPRSGTELATVPPLLCHDPEYLNMAVTTPNADGITATFGDFALLKKENTGTGCVPDAFLCNWLAEYSHPALLGTSREHFMTFRYREAGMPRAYNYPPTKGLFLRNHSNPSSAGVAIAAEPFERVYVNQWLQNYGYNGLNAGGHGNIVGLKSANAVLMGHTTVREPQGTMRLPTEYENIRHTRGEGIGDSINPEKLSGTISYDVDNDSVSFTKYITTLDNMVGYDYGRRLPVRAWGFRTGSDALDMLAGDPNENTSAQQPIYGKGRFDGGIHDSMNKLPNATTHGDSWAFPADYNGVERTTPIGVILTDHTAEATPFASIVRRSNSRPLQSEQKIGIGLTLGHESLGLVKPTAMSAGNWESKIDPNAASTLPLKAIPMNKGSDPFIDLTQYTGSSSYAQANSQSAVSSTQFGVSGGFYHLRGNALHTNASAIDHSNTSNVHYPTSGWGIGTHSDSTITSLLPIPLSEVSDHRQVQSRTEPRLGFVIETENERQTNKNIEYAITSTKAASLHSDLILGQHFPVMPSWTVNTKFTTHNMTINPSSPTSQSISNPYTLPTWSPDSKTDKGDGGQGVASLAISNAGTGYTAGNLTATGGGSDGSGFTGTYTINPLGNITALNITSGVINGAGLSNSGGNGTWTTNGGGGSNAAGTFSYIKGAGFEISATAVTNQGTGYTSQPDLVIANIGGQTVDTGGLGFSFTINTTTGSIAAVSITNSGTGYTSAPTIVMSNAGSSGVVTATLVTVSNSPPIIAAKTHAKDIWSVRGSADLPPWGGTYILRKTYLNRLEHGSLSTEVEGTGGNATTSNQRRKQIDYFVRPVRPLKLYGFASDLLQDGWLAGARSSTGDSNFEYQPFTRDNRYGVFEANLDETLGNTNFVTTAEGAFSIAYPDANEHDVTYHLMPSASMLQFFKSDAARKTIDGNFNPEIEARYSQTTHPGGGEVIHQSQVKYIANGTGIGGDFVKHTTPEGISYTQMNTSMRLFPQFKVADHFSTNIVLEDASLLPSAGTLFLVGKREIHYTGKTKNKLTGVTNSTGVSDLTGEILRYYSNNASDSGTPSTLSDIRPLTIPHLIAPTFVDNTITLSKQVSALWNRYDVTQDAVKQTTLSFRGLLEYDPTDFMMINQKPMIIENGKTSARIKTSNSSIRELRFDGKELTSSYFPPYLFDSKGFSLRIAGLDKEEQSSSLLFRNIKSDSLVDAGLEEGEILMGQKGFVGIRTSDAALMLLDDSGSELAGFNVTPSNSLLAKDREVSSTINAHPSLRLINDHSSIFTARKTRGLNIMEIIRNLTQIDGKQLVNEKNGSLVYSSASFINRGSNLGLGSGIQSVSASKMYDSPNEIVVVGDSMASNERVFVVVKDLEKMKMNANRGSESNLVRTLRQEIPGLKTNNEALKLAKSILSRAENGAPLININGALKASSIQPGEIVTLNLPTHGITGEFVVFEAEHNYSNLTSNFVIAQYDKGIEGLISDIQAVSGNSEPLDEQAGSVVDLVEVSLSSNIEVIAVHRIYVRNVNNVGFIIGAKHTNGMGKIGVRDGNKRARQIGTSKGIFYEVK